MEGARGSPDLRKMLQTPTAAAAGASPSAAARTVGNTGQAVDAEQQEKQRRAHSAALRMLSPSLKNGGADDVTDSPATAASRQLRMASKAGDESEVRRLLSEGVDINSSEGRDGAPALVWASLYGHETVVSLLLEARADVDKPRLCGTTPLMAACDGGHTGAMQRLLDAGADHTCVSNLGATAQSLADDWLGLDGAGRVLARWVRDNPLSAAEKSRARLARTKGKLKALKALKAAGGMRPATASPQKSASTRVRAGVRTVHAARAMDSGRPSSANLGAWAVEDEDSGSVDMFASALGTALPGKKKKRAKKKKQTKLLADAVEVRQPGDEAVRLAEQVREAQAELRQRRSYEECLRKQLRQAGVTALGWEDFCGGKRPE